MNDVIGQKYIFAVAQRPFETTGESGIYNQFCALLPLFAPDGVPAHPREFPDNGDVWWMVRAGTRGLAEPGRLVTGIVEDSVKSGTPGYAQFQVNVDSVTALHGRDYVEIIDIPAAAIQEPRDIINSAFRHTLDHSPVDTVCIRWKDYLIGRFRALAEESSIAPGQWHVRFAPEASDHMVFRVNRDSLDRIHSSKVLVKNCYVSLERRPLHESTDVNAVQYTLVDSEALMREVPADSDRVSMRTDREVIQQLAKSLYTRGKRQQLMTLLDDLGDLAGQSEEPFDTSDTAVLNSLRCALESDSKASNELARAIIAAGFMKTQIEAAIAEREEKHVADNAARLQSEVNRRLADIRAELEKLQAERNAIQSEFAHLRSRKKKELEKELKARRAEFDRELRRKEEDASKRLKSIQRQEKVLADNLRKVAGTLLENRDEIVNQLLTIAPVLSQFGFLFGPAPESTHTALPSMAAESLPENTSPDTDGEQGMGFRLPIFTSADDSRSVEEGDFFDRLKTYTSARGFRYRDIDLLAFHVSVKCGDLTILGGQPGTGKSSLPRLYTEALRGEIANESHERFLHVAVSPSWLDSRDLLGHLNALNHTFQPADSGLYETLIYAQEEHEELGDQSGMYFVLLDEMNLSHVEHYFGDFLQVLEMRNSKRQLRVFSRDAVAATCEFRRWASLKLPESLRFVGTVNFDETTKQLSQRLLDRVNLIRLPAGQLPLELVEATDIKLTGQEVRTDQYQSWIRDSAVYSDDLGLLIDDLRDDLRILNCAMNPRRFSAIRKFLASWPEQISPIEQAIDVQIAQRILPQIRGLFQPGANDAVNAVRRKLEQHTIGFDESLRVLDEIYRTESPEFIFEPEAMS